MRRFIILILALLTLYRPVYAREACGVFVDMGMFKCTAYCPCCDCSEGYDDTTAMETKAEEGHTIIKKKRSASQHSSSRFVFVLNSIKRLAYTSIYRYHFFRKLLHPNEGFHHRLIDCVDLLPIGLRICPRNLQGILVAEAVVDECKVISEFPGNGCPGMASCVEGEVFDFRSSLPFAKIVVDLLVACMLLRTDSVEFRKPPPTTAHLEPLDVVLQLLVGPAVNYEVLDPMFLVPVLDELVSAVTHLTGVAVDKGVGKVNYVAGCYPCAGVHKDTCIETYVIPGKRGSGCICINGAAAHLVHVGDMVIIMAYALMTEDEVKTFKPAIIFPNNNRV